ncbi:ABC transporter permease [Nonomuraea maheshkhaliensis]|uniref:Transport permease protein n=2 Tax=Nonomuraea maheshkhaliensis TaxID=419590 RepID=A0ABN2FN06_9ACTN
MAATETKLLLRDPAAVIFPLLLPLALVLVLGLGIPGLRQPMPELGGQRWLDTQLPATMTLLSAALTALTILPVVLTTYRDSGVLRRMSTTPAPPARLLAVQLVLYLVLVLAATALMIVLGRVVVGIAVPMSFAWFVLVLLLGTAALLALGLLLAVLTPSAKAAPGMGTLVMFPLLFFGGMWVPYETMPAGLQRFSDLTPTGAFSQALRATWSGTAPQPLQLAVLAGWLLVAGILANRLFRWE